MPSKPFLSEPDAVVVMPTESLQQTAKEFAQQHPTNAERIYLNTLAVGVVDQYFRLLGIKTNITQGDSWNPVLRMVNDVADLDLPDYGRVECRVITANATDCYVPADVSCDRIAYVVVRLDLDSAKIEAALLGFVTEVESEYISLSRLRDLSEIPQHLQKASTLNN